ncbi:hypothetical protein BDV96DRAFT_605039 [Lophiotrema nucula]|uniref:Uncharacterized protein n=1 Tax=Lophiotrema nucula TaxID=690887 RepID=A0A6A5YTB5_9PLEO|nr:hypothetical protein BDV96DRAFT_605039 [Lophiotrema nucula]
MSAPVRHNAQQPSAGTMSAPVRHNAQQPSAGTMSAPVRHNAQQPSAGTMSALVRHNAQQPSAGTMSAPVRHNAQQPGSYTTVETLPQPQISFLKLFNMDCNEEHIDSRLPYRIGCPTLPVLPVESRESHQNLDTAFPNWFDHQYNIYGVFRKHDIPLEAMHFEYRVNHGIAASDCYLTLVLVSRYDHGCQDQWVKAVKEIRSSLVQSEIYWTIELIDQRVYNTGPPHVSPILSTDRDLIEGWKRVKPDFYATMENRDWKVVDVFRRAVPYRAYYSKMEPTIIISAADANDDIWWRSTLPALRQLLEANSMKADIVVVFHKGLSLMTAAATLPKGGFEPNPTLREAYYDCPLSMGTSCGTSGSTSSGTLGGRIKLQKGGSIHELGLTNFHVLKDAFKDQGSISGPFHPDPAQLYETVVSPSDRDHRSALELLLDAQDKFHQTFGHLLALEPECFSTLDLDDGQKFDQVRAVSTREQSLERALDRVCQARHDDCRIYAASGFRTRNIPPNNWALDWCLFKVGPLTGLLPETISCQADWVPSIARHLCDEDKVTQYCKISANEHYQVMKRGRTSGWTRGTISAIDSTIRMETRPEDPKLKLPTNQQVRFKEKFGDELVSVHAIVGTKSTEPFLYPGDSGSLVLLDQASNIPGVSIVGLACSGNVYTLASYMIPMDVVVADIEEVTGGQVIEPEYKGEVSVVHDQVEEEEGISEEPPLRLYAQLF